MKIAEHRPTVIEYLRRGGPAHAADIVRDVPVPRGSVYKILRSPEFRQLADARWELAAPPFQGPSACWPPGLVPPSP